MGNNIYTFLMSYKMTKSTNSTNSIKYNQPVSEQSKSSPHFQETIYTFESGIPEIPEIYKREENEPLLKKKSFAE